jgi:hypothetical protein
MRITVSFDGEEWSVWEANSITRLGTRKTRKAAERLADKIRKEAGL